MTRTRIKICGIRDEATAHAAAEAGADAVGLVFATGSPRCVTVAQANAIAQGLPPYVDTVGLFVDADVEAIGVTVEAAGLGTVQLHGNEPVELAEALSPRRVVKAVHFVPGRLADLMRMWGQAGENVAGLLVDTPPAAEGELPGGSGRAYDWDALAKELEQIPVQERLPVILAGGLTVENVADAVRIVRPWAVDVSSGVESSRGVKDIGRIKAFCDAVREADRL